MNYRRTVSQLAVILGAVSLFLIVMGCPNSQTHNANSSRGKDAVESHNSEKGGEERADKSASGKNKKHTQKLFIIERSKNANIVRYDAQITSDGTLNAEKPVIAYWILKADEGQRAELSTLQRKFAYGFSTRPAESGDGFVMKMVPLPERDIRIRKVDTTVRAELKIDEKRAILTKVYVDSDSTWTGPEVNYVKLFGKATKGGEKLTEKIVRD